MRDIKFRGKRFDNAEWVYGYLYKCYKFARIITAFAYTNEDGENEDLGQYYCEAYDVDINTLCQFTGLCDKNGKEIYEGDIVHCWDTIAKCEIWAVVEFGNPNAEYTWGWQLRKIKGSKGVNLDILCWVECEETNAYCEIIGTVYDNPELLKGE